jgi:hypothetical protein
VYKRQGQNLLKDFMVDFKAFAKVQALKAVEQLPKAMELAAKKTPTPIDDAIVAALSGSIKDVAKEFINKM